MIKIYMLLCLAALLAGCGEEAQTPPTQSTQADNSPNDAETPQHGNGQQPQNDDRPSVIETTPTNNGENIAPTTTTIIIKFSEDMTQSLIALERLGGCEYPKNTDAPLFEDPRTLILSVKLDENKTYGLSLNKINEVFQSADGKPLAPFTLKFTTGKDEGRFVGLTALEKKHHKGEIPSGEYYLNLYLEEGVRMKVSTEIFVQRIDKTTMQGAYGATPSTGITTVQFKQDVEEEILEIRNKEIRKRQCRFGDSFIKSSTQNVEAPTMDLSVADKTYMIEGDGDETKITREGRKIVGQEKDTVLEAKNHPDLYPANAVKIGAKWPLKSDWLLACVLTPPAVAALMTPPGSDDYSITCTLSEIKTVDGHRIASITFKGKVNITHNQLDQKFALAVAGEVLYDLTNRRIESLTALGSGSASGMMQQNVALETGVDFTCKFSWTYD